MNRKKREAKKPKNAAIELETLVYFIIALVVLAISLFGYLYLKNQGMGAIDFIKNLFRFRK